MSPSIRTIGLLSLAEASCRARDGYALTPHCQANGVSAIARAFWKLVRFSCRQLSKGDITNPDLARFASSATVFRTVKHETFLALVWNAIRSPFGCWPQRERESMAETDFGCPLCFCAAHDQSRSALVAKTIPLGTSTFHLPSHRWTEDPSCLLDILFFGSTIRLLHRKPDRQPKTQLLILPSSNTQSIRK